MFDDTIAAIATPLGEVDFHNSWITHKFPGLF